MPNAPLALQRQTTHAQHYWPCACGLARQRRTRAFIYPRLLLWSRAHHTAPRAAASACPRVDVNAHVAFTADRRHVRARAQAACRYVREAAVPSAGAPFAPSTRQSSVACSLT
eukprot:6207232-Pleurochrysis_carterae.AAC.5